MNRERLGKLLDEITAWINKHPNDRSLAGNLLVIAEQVLDDELGADPDEGGIEGIEHAAEMVAREEMRAIISAEKRR